VDLFPVITESIAEIAERFEEPAPQLGSMALFDLRRRESTWRHWSSRNSPFLKLTPWTEGSPVFSPVQDGRCMAGGVRQRLLPPTRVFIMRGLE
jgi:hypothetical protein